MIKGISFKTSIVCGLIVVVSLSISSLLSIKLQSSFSQTLINQFTINQKSELKEESISEKATNQLVRKLHESISEKATLVTNTHIHLEICKSIASSYLYNLDDLGLKKLLASYMQFETIVAIKVTDSDGKPFSAA